MVILADVSFNLAFVAAPGAVGRIDNILYWVPGMANTVPLLGAVNMPLNTPITLYVQWSNRGEVVFTGHVDLSVYKPDGATLTPAAVNFQDVVAPPGGGAVTQFSAVVLDQVGAWRGRATLSG